MSVIAKTTVKDMGLVVVVYVQILQSNLIIIPVKFVDNHAPAMYVIIAGVSFLYNAKIVVNGSILLTLH